MILLSLWNWNNHFVGQLMFQLWQMEQLLCMDGWCYSHCGRWNCHILLINSIIVWQMEEPHMCWLMLLPAVADGIATCVMANVITTCHRWNNHLFWYGWCCCHCGRLNSHIGWNVVKPDLITMVADGKATGSIYFNFSSVLLIKT